MRTTGETIRAARLAAGWTQKHVAVACGVTRATVSHWEIGRGLPSPRAAEAIRAHLGVDIPARGPGRPPRRGLAVADLASLLGRPGHIVRGWLRPGGRPPLTDAYVLVGAMQLDDADAEQQVTAWGYPWADVGAGPETLAGLLRRYGLPAADVLTLSLWACLQRAGCTPGEAMAAHWRSEIDSARGAV